MSNLGDYARPRAARETTYLRPQPGPQVRFMGCPADICIFGGEAGGGKLLRLSTPVPTPGGWTTMGALVAGDVVLGRDGRTCRVVVAHAPAMPERAYRVLFSDGSQIVAGGDHLWVTQTERERGRVLRQSDAFRAHRRERRASRAVAPTTLRSQVTSQRNRDLARVHHLPLEGVRDTDEIARTLKSERGAWNHSIDACGVLDLPHAELPLDPYLLGCWLGDGHSHSGGITSMDESIHAAFASVFTPGARIQRGKAWTITYLGLTTTLRHLGVLNAKCIPMSYLRAAPTQRWALLRGLMDTDGTCSTDGKSSFTTTRAELRDDVLDLLHGLGCVAKASEGRAKLYGRDCGPVWDIHFASAECPFALARKSARWRPTRRPTTRRRYIVSCEPVPVELMRCITVDSPDRTYLCGDDMIPTHNSWAALLEHARWCELPGYAGVVFRRDGSQLVGSGSIWESAVKLFGGLGARMREGGNMDAKWPSGAHVMFRGLQREDDVYGYQSYEFTQITFEELTGFSESQFVYMLSRLRSTCGVRPYVRATCNPDPTSWVRQFIDWWIAPDGTPDPTRDGVVRWVVREGDKWKWFDSESEGLAWCSSIGDTDAKPRSVTFIRSRLADNPALEEKNPEYRATLALLDPIKRAQLLGGNWNIQAAGGAMFKRKWFDVVDSADESQVYDRVRGWDFAGKAPTPEYPNPDWTRGVRLAKYRSGKWLVEDMCSLRDTFGAVKRLVARVTTEDGPRVTQAIWQGPAETGLAYADEIEGVMRQALPSVKVVRKVASKNKIEYASPVSGAWDWETFRQSRVALVRGGWNTEYLAELEAFPSKGVHDDAVDATSRAYMELDDGDYASTWLAAMRRIKA